MYKGTSYNLITIFLMVIIGFVVGASGGFSTDASDIVIDDLPEEEIIQNIEDVDLGDFIPPASDASAFDRLEFAFNVLEEGEGFSSQLSQEVVSMGMTQKVYIKQYRAGEYNLSEEWQSAGFPQGKNQFALTYSDSQQVKIKKITNTSKYSYSEKTYSETYSDSMKNVVLSDYLQTHKTLNSNPVTINENTSSVVKYDKRSDPNYYVITVSVDTGKIDDEYYTVFEENGTKGIKFSTLSFEFKINKTTGFLYKVKKTENFTTDYGIFKNISCVGVMVQFFTQVNASAIDYITQAQAANF